MKADSTGTPTEQARAAAGWHTATKGEGRCDGCQRSDITPSGTGGQDKIHCPWINAATKPNATCEFYAPILQPEPAPSEIINSATHPLARGILADLRMPAYPADFDVALNRAGPVLLNAALSGTGISPGRRDAIKARLAVLKGAEAKAEVEAVLSVAARHAEEINRSPDAGVLPKEYRWQVVGSDETKHCRACIYLRHLDSENTHYCGLNSIATWERATCKAFTPKPIEEPMAQEELPTVSEILAATDTPDKALPILKKQDGQEVELYDQRRVINECRFYMSQSAEAMLEAGKRLIELKKHEPHGEFERIVESELNLPTRTAQRMMQSAIKFSSPALTAKAPALALLGKTKLFELLTEDDDDLAELADGGTLAGKTLDEIDRMTSRELKAALRKAKEDARQEVENLKADLAAKDKRIAKKDERINELEDKIDRKVHLPDTAEIEKYAADLDNEVVAIYSRITAGLRARCLAVQDSHTDSHAEHGRLLIAQALGRIISGARILAADLDIVPAENAGSAFEQVIQKPGQKAFDMLNAELDAESYGE